MALMAPEETIYLDTQFELCSTSRALSLTKRVGISEVKYELEGH